jgi:hypothetical protein
MELDGGIQLNNIDTSELGDNEKERIETIIDA